MMILREKSMDAKTLLGISIFVFITIMLSACQTTNDSAKNGSSVVPASNASTPIGDQQPQLVSRIVSSTAGDKNWQVAYQTNWMDLASIECAENQTCYSLTEGDAILRTTDGGTSWDKLRSAEMVVHSDSPFACAQEGFCLLIESINGGNVWVTYNGGTTWEKSGASPVNSPESLACPTSEKCILVTRQGEVFSTEDGGKIWQRHLASSGITYKNITCLNESVCYIAGMVFAGEYGVVAKTIDGGLTWKQVSESPVRGLRAISCPTPSDCVSVGRFGVQITQDGGQVWRELSVGVNGARSVDCSSPKNCFIIDGQGQLISWDGVDLVKQKVEDEFSLRGVSCPSGDKCYVVGAFTARNSKLPVSDFGNNLNVSIGLVFLAGIVSFLSPCVLPVLPGYLTYLAARSSSQEIGKVSRWQVLMHGMAFVAGFSIVFITLGATASIIGQSLYNYKEWITRIGGVMIVFFGLQMAGLLRIPFLEFEIRKHAEPNPRLGYNISSLLMGVFFSAGWTPCVGPTLGIVLTLAGTQASMTKGILLLALFSFGLGLPFIITALAMDRVGKWMRRMASLTRYVMLVAGVLLVGVGMLLILGKLNFLNGLLPGLAIYM
jgi:cytochrome c-type biogenesis protein